MMRKCVNILQRILHSGMKSLFPLEINKVFIIRYNIHVYESKKATMKLLTECEKLKKLMAANTNKLPINIESFIDDKDVTGKMDRAMFEELIAGHLADIKKVIWKVLAASKLKPEEIYR